jgi:hypothetical protein
MLVEGGAHWVVAKIRWVENKEVKKIGEFSQVPAKPSLIWFLPSFLGCCVPFLQI